MKTLNSNEITLVSGGLGKFDFDDKLYGFEYIADQAASGLFVGVLAGIALRSSAFKFHNTVLATMGVYTALAATKVLGSRLDTHFFGQPATATTVTIAS